MGSRGRRKRNSPPVSDERSVPGNSAQVDNIELIYGVKPKPWTKPKPMVSRWLDDDGKQVPLDVSVVKQVRKKKSLPEKKKIPPKKKKAHRGQSSCVKKMLRIEKQSKRNRKTNEKRQKLYVVCRDCGNKTTCPRKRFYKSAGFTDRCLLCGGMLDRHFVNKAEER